MGQHLRRGVTPADRGARARADPLVHLARDRFGVAKRGPLAPVVRGALASLGASLPRRLPVLLSRARATAATLHYSIASKAAIARAHEQEAAVYVWTVDDPRLAERLVRDGADGIITTIRGSLRCSRREASLAPAHPHGRPADRRGDCIWLPAADEPVPPRNPGRRHDRRGAGGRPYCGRGDGRGRAGLRDAARAGARYDARARRAGRAQATPVVDKAIERALAAEPNAAIPLGVSIVPGTGAAHSSRRLQSASTARDQLEAVPAQPATVAVEGTRRTQAHAA